MRNKYPGACYICDKIVEKGAGHFERNGRGGWRLRHVKCRAEKRKTGEKGRAAIGQRMTKNAPFAARPGHLAL